MKTAYHGTSLVNARAIYASGEFCKGTWFAINLQAALKFGGPVVFECVFDPDGFRGGGCERCGGPDWQFWLRDPLPISSISHVRYYDVHPLLPATRQPYSEGDCRRRDSGV